MEKCFGEKGRLDQFFSSLKVLLTNNFQLHSHCSLCYKMFLHLISKPLDLEQMRMGWIRNNSVGKKKIEQRIFKRQFSVAMINSILAIFTVTMKITNNSKTKQKVVRFVTSIMWMHGMQYISYHTQSVVFSVSNIYKILAWNI